MDSSKAIAYELGEFLKRTVADLREVHLEWPDATQELDLPCASIMVGPGQFSPEANPYPLNAAELGASAYATKSMDVQYVVGWFDFTMQLDIWTGSKFDRDRLLANLQNAFASQFPVHGLSLQLSQYYDVWARYDMGTFEFVNDEASAQRREWRTKLDVLAHCKKIYVAKQNLIKDGEITFDTYRQDEETKDAGLS